jgi:hypothetical protein
MPSTLVYGTSASSCIPIWQAVRGTPYRQAVEDGSSLQIYDRRSEYTVDGIRAYRLERRIVYAAREIMYVPP